MNDSSEKAIELYLRDGSRFHASQEGSVEEYVRTLPIDPVFQLEGIGLRQNGEKVERVIENGKPVEIEVRYRVKQRVGGLRIYFDLCDDQGAILFRSFHDEDNDGMPTTNIGVYASRATIPADLLAPMQYELKIYATIFNVKDFFPNGIVFPLSVERTGKANRAYLSEPIRGKLAPVISWVTTQA